MRRQWKRVSESCQKRLKLCFQKTPPGLDVLYPGTLLRRSLDPLSIPEDSVAECCDTMEKQPKSIINSDEGSSESEAKGGLAMG